jgi:hypothetical protein
MGQYYKPIILAENKKTVMKWMYSHKYNNGLKLMEHSYVGNNFVGAFESLIKDNPKRVVWAGDYADDCRGRKTNLYSRCKDSLEVTPTANDKDVRFIINHTKKTFVDKHKGSKGNDGWQIHPLPLLTCEGNGRGESSLIGSWARDVISVSDTKPKDFEELVFDLVE